MRPDAPPQPCPLQREGARAPLQYMNSEQSPDPSSILITTIAPDQTTPTGFDRIRSFLQQHLVGTIMLSTCLNLGFTGAVTWGVWNTARQLEVTTNQDPSGKLTEVDNLAQRSRQRQALSEAIVLELIGLGLSIVTGSLVLLTVRSYVLDREKAQKSLETFQAGLVDLNEQLQQEAHIRSVEQDRVAQESAFQSAWLLRDGNPRHWIFAAVRQVHG